MDLGIKLQLNEMEDKINTIKEELDFIGSQNLLIIKQNAANELMNRVILNKLGIEPETIDEMINDIKEKIDKEFGV